MIKCVLILSLAALIFSCGGNGQAGKQTATASDSTKANVDASMVNVYYFHGKQRCKTCLAVGELAKQTVESAYAGNGKVRFTEIDTSEKQFEDLVQKYEVSWNALIVVKGDASIDLTETAFANALEHPEVLSNLLKDEISKRLN